jgi:hypothetical protein
MIPAVPTQQITSVSGPAARRPAGLTAGGGGAGGGGGPPMGDNFPPGVGASTLEPTNDCPHPPHLIRACVSGFGTRTVR